MEAINDSTRLIAQAIEIMKHLEMATGSSVKANAEAIELLTIALDKLSECI